MIEIFEEYGELIIAMIGGIFVLIIVGEVFVGNGNVVGLVGEFVKGYMEQMLG